MTVDLRLQRWTITARSATARLRRLAELAPDRSSGQRLRQAAQELSEVTRDVHERLGEVLAEEPGYPLERSKR